MKHHSKWLAAPFAAAMGLAIAGSARAQIITTVSDFHNFNLTALYANWGSGYVFTPPVITSGPTSYEIVAQGYGSGAYYPISISAPGATQVQLTFTLNQTMAIQPGVNDFMGPNFDLSDGTHQVQYLEYAHYDHAGTYTVTAPIGSLDPANITAFNLEFDPGSWGSGSPYDITYNSLVLVTPVPEPASLALVGLGIGGFVLARRRARVA